MSEHIYKKIEMVGTSDISIEAAVNNAIAASHKTLRHIRWFEVDEIRGSVKDGQVDQWQVGLKLAFTVEQESPGDQRAESAETTASGKNPAVS